MKVEKEVPTLTTPWGPRGGCSPRGPFLSTRSRSHHLGKRACHSPSQRLLFPSRAKAKFGPTGSWGSGEIAPEADLPLLLAFHTSLPCARSDKEASPSPTAAPPLPKDQGSGVNSSGVLTPVETSHMTSERGLVLGRKNSKLTGRDQSTQSCPVAHTQAHPPNPHHPPRLRPACGVDSWYSLPLPVPSSLSLATL